jgi:hypothetical protein
MRWHGYIAKVWFRNCLSAKGAEACLSALGALGTIGAIVLFFYPDFVLPTWAIPCVVAIAVFYTFYRCYPQLVFSHKLSGRDISIELVVGDIMSLPGTLIIGSNTTFDTHISERLISARSVQGLFTRKYYSGETQLDAEITTQLATITSEQLQSQRLGKTKKYQVGTCVALRPKSQTAYLLAIANINEHGVASGNFADLQNALAQLWLFIGTRGPKEPLLIPVIGSGFTRLRESREVVIREIVQSFLAACSERTFTDRLSIVILPQDMLDHEISLEELDMYLKVQCRYREYATGSRPPTGTPA